MLGANGSLSGFKGARSDILVALKKNQPLTAKALAERFGVTTNALRRHLKELELEGVVGYRREVRGVGGPVHEYRLTEEGERLFPRSYDQVLAQALEIVREQFGSDAVVEIFRQRWKEIADRVRPELAHLTVTERAQRLAQMLTSLGYMAEASGEDGATIREHNCTIRAVVEQFPEVCAAEQRFIQEVLGVDVTRQTHIAKGANCCEYCVAEPARLSHRPATDNRIEPAGSKSRLQETT
ncbi:MAG: helix-turn-helix transcriptional regulator [Gemmatimonadaceae bacterium]